MKRVDILPLLFSWMESFDCIPSRSAINICESFRRPHFIRTVVIYYHDSLAVGGGKTTHVRGQFCPKKVPPKPVPFLSI